MFKAFVVLMLLVCLAEANKKVPVSWENPPRYLGCICNTAIRLAARDLPCGETVQNLTHDRCVRFTGDMERQSCALDGGSERADYMPVYVGGVILWVDVRHMKHAKWKACQPNDENDLPRSSPPPRCPGWPFCVELPAASTAPTVPAAPAPARRSFWVKGIDPKDLTEGTCLCMVDTGKFASNSACKKAQSVLTKGDCFTYRGSFKTCKDSDGNPYSHLSVNALYEGAYVKSTVVRVAKQAMCHRDSEDSDCDGSASDSECARSTIKPETTPVYYPPRYGCQ